MRRPPRTGRFLALVAALVVVSLGAAGCDTSPYAASVNSQVVKQTALQVELRNWAGNPGYVKAFNQANQQNGLTVTGAGPGTYSAAFSAFVLNQMVQASAIRQDLAAHHRLPSAAALAAARSVQEVEFANIWQGFSAPFRDQLVTELADSASIESAPTDITDLQAAFMSKQQYFFSRVCTREITVSVLGANGAIDYAASKTRADQIVNQDYSRGSGALSLPATAGAPTCYTPAQLEDQAPAFFAEVLGLAPGQAATPQRTTAGYSILAVDSRVLQRFSAATASVLAFAVTQSTSTPALVRVLGATTVKVNPAFGTWNTSQLQVEPSTVPGDLYNKSGGVVGVSSGQLSG